MGRKNFNNVFQSMKGWIATAWSYKKKKKKKDEKDINSEVPERKVITFHWQDENF